MRVKVSGKQINLGETLPAGVRARLEDVVGKHFDGGADGHVVFSHEGPFYKVDCVLHLDSHTIITVEGKASDVHRAFDAAYKRIEARLRTYKRKLKNHHAKAAARRRAPAEGRS
ncbi:MAG: ribosome-associated translation inhibitor RaiA [Proteobacteria bacterium]|nr:ribosome-associated translation inhibitor RaiA [Pseudomonadota bacterium]